MTVNQETRPTLLLSRRDPYSKWWLLAKAEHSRVEVLTVSSHAEGVMPVFSGEGEAEMFLWLGSTFERGWRVRETSAGELASLLSGPYACVRSVALDPSPEMAGSGTIGLVSVGRERFLGRVLTLGGRWIVPKRSRGPVSLRTTGERRPRYRFS